MCTRKRNHIKMTHLPQESPIKWPLLPARMNESVYQVPCFVPPHSTEHYNPPSPAAELPFSLTVIPRQLWHPAAISIQTLTLKFPSAYYWQSSFSTTVQLRRAIKNTLVTFVFRMRLLPMKESAGHADGAHFLLGCFFLFFFKALSASALWVPTNPSTTRLVVCSLTQGSAIRVHLLHHKAAAFPLHSV